jgi:hypothetical protein
MKKIYSDILYVVLIVSVILFMIFIVRMMINESGKCLSNPFSYISNKKGYEDLNCYCSRVGNGTLTGFRYNSSGVFRLK